MPYPPQKRRWTQPVHRKPALFPLDLWETVSRLDKAADRPDHIHIPQEPLQWPIPGSHPLDSQRPNSPDFVIPQDSWAENADLPGFCRQDARDRETTLAETSGNSKPTEMRCELRGIREQCCPHCSHESSPGTERVFDGRGFVPTMNHAVTALGISAGAVFFPFRIFHQFLKR